MVAFCEIQNLGFSSILCHLFLTSVVFLFLFFIKYISIKSLGVKGYSFYFLTTINDMISQKKWGGNFSFPVVCFHCRLWEDIEMKWQLSWERWETMPHSSTHTSIANLFLFFNQWIWAYWALTCFIWMFHIKSFYKRLGHLGRNLPLQPEIA